MSTTSNVTDSAGIPAYSPSTVKATGKSEMGQADFLRLLTAQMQTQDPFEPMDNAQMVAQMATITNSSGIAEMNATMKSLASQLTGSRLGDAASWIGKSMLVESNIAAPDAAGQYIGQLTLGSDAENVSVDLVDGNGNTVKTIDLGAQSKGDVNFYWDGKDEAGETVADGPLQIKVNGANPNRVASWAAIAAVQSPADGSASKLITALGTYSPADAISLA
ncbi:flagellar basal-body rod modification protein FlgD [Sphingobium wenxiniae]|uniref:Basal-body rod modification protein FlgD n=3 Tax=Sphingobium TaxID=165695 RepID=A0A0S3EX72_9SPHN|nr:MULTISPECIES: flagellar hook capping FlgD N-terminal domain-containing protein [Sphingobium]ALR20020.1 flagellar hook capping protein [Sphingobium baderi]EQB02483.1 flagellar hook capping protein [Sphingobium baderi LL03]KMS60795.1 flagellar hook capping protein [Sphingobium baderi LL03]MBB6191321.1 flagellar basal-body rod modification protein FlgD [Sphingobium wenxiniae]TWH93384.1 flagellar basal-body rod modification protein FlgD [Sphingobium wenxiniae]